MRGAVGALALLVAGATTVAVVEPRLAAAAHRAKEVDDVSFLPPPAQLRLGTFGWDAAAVDLLWAKLLVEYGTHWETHREFHDVPRYADAILAIEPTYRPLYRTIATLLAYRPLRGSEDDVRMARAYLERGMRERPDDARIWVEYGQFLAFVAPSFLTAPAESNAWRKEGAEALGHAVELGADADDALTAATLLDEAGVRLQAIRFLEHAYAITPLDSEIHEALGQRLASLQARAQRDASDARRAAFEARRRREMPYVPPSLYRLLGPRVDPDHCAGVSSAGDPACARDWIGALGEPASPDVSADELGSSVGSP
jgi:hypothetical protein